MSPHEDPDEPITVDLQLDETLRKAAAWRSLSIDDYVRSVVATMAEADAKLADFARDSLADGGHIASEGDLDVWFAAERERQGDL